MFRQTGWYRSLNQFFNTRRTKKARKRSTAAHTRRMRRFEFLEDRTVLSASFGSALTFGNGLESSSASDVATDSAGYSYVAGSFRGTVDFDLNNVHAGDVDILTARGSSDAFVAKYGPDNSLIWARSMGGDVISTSLYRDIARKLTVDSSGAVYVVGEFEGSSDFGATTLTSVGIDDCFITKLDDSGNFQWAKRWGNYTGSSLLYKDFAFGVEVDAAGNAYALGVRVSEAHDIMKFSPTGNSVWSKTIDTQSDLLSGDLAVSAAGTVYVAGSFDGWVDFDPGSRTRYVSSGAERAGFVLKLDTNGKYGWVSPFVGKTVGSTTGSSGAVSIALDDSGNIVVGGIFAGTVDFNPGRGRTYLTAENGAFITKLNSRGSLVWAKPLLGDATTYVGGLDTDASGNIYATGTFHGTVDLDPGAGVYSRTTAGLADSYVMKLTSSGNLAWAETFGGTGDDYFRGISVDTNGDVLTAGSYGDPFDVDPDPLSTELLPGDGTAAYGLCLRLHQI